MITLRVILQILAIVSFGAAAVSVPTPRVNLVALGLFFLAVSMVIIVV